MEFFKKLVGKQWYPNQLYGSPLSRIFTLKYEESLLGLP